jgi:hypothetical protein
MLCGFPEVPSTDVFEILPLDEADARSFIATLMKLSEHPELVALREKQEAACTFGTQEGAAEYRALEECVSREMKDAGSKD